MQGICYMDTVASDYVSAIGGSKGGGIAPPKAWQKLKNSPIWGILHYQKQIFPEGMPPDPPNSLIYSVFLALAATGPLQCESLEPPVIWTNVFWMIQVNSPESSWWACK